MHSNGLCCACPWPNHLTLSCLARAAPLRINSKLREKSKKEEAKRLREFVDAAYKTDPRVTARREEERLEK